MTFGRQSSASAGWEIKRASAVPHPAISVVMPVYNRQDMVGEAVASALKLAAEAAFELIIVDDGSTDGTREILSALSAPSLTLVFLKANAGANTARNIGASLARAPVLAFLDSDDTYLPGRLARPLAILAQHPHVGIVLSSFTVAKQDKSSIVRMPDRTYERDTFLRLLAQYVLPASTPGITIRRDTFAAAGGFDPTVKRIQDLDMLLRAARLTGGASISTPLWHKNWQPDGISSGRATYFAALLALIERHPLYHETERRTRDYLIARHIISLGLSRQLFQARRDYTTARRQLTSAPISLPSLARAYFATHRARRRAKLELLDKPDASGLVSTDSETPSRT